MTPQKITPCLWFDTQAAEAARLYTSIFPDSELGSMTPGPNGEPLVVEFRLAGVSFIALNGGPQFPFTEAISLSVTCVDQREVDDLWDRLGDGGTPSRCGWLKDRYGLSWQIVPAILPKLLSDPARRGRVMEALLQMDKLDIARLQSAAEGN